MSCKPSGLAATGGYVGTTGIGADGEFLRAGANENADLFWGLRGGAGNFGIVTSFEFQVHPAGTVLAGLVLHPLSKGREALRFWRQYEETAPEAMSNGALLFTPPPELPLPEVLRPGIAAMGGVYVGPLEEGERALEPLRGFGPPAADIYQCMPYSAAQGMADFLWPRGRCSYWKSSFLKSLSDGAIDTLLDFYARTPSPHTVIVLEHNGDGVFSRMPADATAFGHRQWRYNFAVTAAWIDPAESEKNIRWTRELWDAMGPYRAEAAYINYQSDLTEDAVRTAYGEKYERLAALKEKYDPTNFFCMNQNIKPSSARAAAS